MKRQKLLSVILAMLMIVVLSACAEDSDGDPMDGDMDGDVDGDLDGDEPDGDMDGDEPDGDMDGDEPDGDEDGDMDAGYMDVSAADAKKLIEDNPDIIIIDVSPVYDEGHIPGAVSYPLGDGSLDDAIPMLDKDDMYLVYCHTDAASMSGAQKLVDAGFTMVYRLEGNFAAWVAAGYDVEGGEGYMDVSAADAKKLIEDNPDIIIIDVSPVYDEGHIPGAVSYPLGDGSLDDAIPMLDKDDMYLVYCHTDAASMSGAQKLVDAGFTMVYRLEGNFAAWVAAGYDVDVTPTTFRVTIENVTMAYSFLDSGVFNTPVGASEAGPVGPDAAYEFSFKAAPGQKLSFATMFVPSNDLFYAPGTAGIALYDGSNNPNSGDITDQIMLWDAGTEVNQEPGIGSDQPMRQSGPNTGAAESGMVKAIGDVSDGFTYPAVSDVLEATLTYEGAGVFTVRLENVSTATTLMPSSGTDDQAVPIAPGVFVVHGGDNPLFAVGMADGGHGLEALAEDGSPADLANYLDGMTGLVSPIAPGVWAISKEMDILFAEGSADAGHGLEGLAEDASPEGLSTWLGMHADVLATGIFNTPEGETSPGPAFPGDSFTFEFDAAPGDALFLGTMLGQSNDLFFAPDGMGVALFDNGNMPVSGDVTAQFFLWDAGTETNEAPGAGPNQAPRQTGPNTGMDENGTVEKISNVNDGFEYPAASEVIQVSIGVL